MDYAISPMSPEDRESVIDIFNYYIEHTFAAYPEQKLPYQAFDILLQRSDGYPTGSIRDRDGRTVGFGLLRAHNPLSSFSHTAESAYFILPGHTGKGLGKRLLAYLEEEGRKRGITNILVHISSLNPGSIRFHQRSGFTECGRFRNVGRKNGQEFDTVWMQKVLTPPREQDAVHP